MKDRATPPADGRWPVVNPDVFAPLPRHAVEAMVGSAPTAPQFVIQLPVSAASIADAAKLAAALARSVAFLPDIDTHATTVSEADDAAAGHRVFCDRMLPDRRNCPLRADHDGPCTADPTRPQ